MTTRKLSVLTAAALCLGTAGSANAQYGPPPPPPGGAPMQATESGVVHDGFMVGLSGGLGSMMPDCDGCDSESGFAFGFSIGGFIRPDLAVMYDVNAVMHFDEDGYGDSIILTNSINTLAVQKWVGPQTWVKGGVGFARLFVTGDNVDDDASTNGFGLSAAAGYEISQNGNFAFDAQLRIASGFYDENDADLRVTNVSLLLGANWY